MTVTGIIFDCDGTLLDSMEAWLSTEAQLAAQAGIKIGDEESTYIGTLRISEVGTYFHEKFGLGTSAEDVVSMIYEIMRINYRTCVKPRLGALEFVRQASSQGIVCSVASATPLSLLTEALELTGFAPYLKAIVSVEEVGVSKGNPAVYDYALSKMGTDKESTWVFEDAAYALKTVKDAGYPAIGIYDCDIAGTHEQLSIADLVIDNFNELDIAGFIGN